jgi:hypothetical protein
MKRILGGHGMHRIWLEAAANNLKKASVKHPDPVILSPIAWSAFYQLVGKGGEIPLLEDYSNEQTFPACIYDAAVDACDQYHPVIRELAGSYGIHLGGYRTVWPLCLKAVGNFYKFS